MESNVDDFDPYEQDIGNEQFDIGTTDDRIEDEEIDEGIEDEAEKDAESQPFIPSSSDKAESTKYEDDEPDSVTSESESEAGYRSWSESSLPVCILSIFIISILKFYMTSLVEVVVVQENQLAKNLLNLYLLVADALQYLHWIDLVNSYRNQVLYEQTIRIIIRQNCHKLDYL